MIDLTLMQKKTYDFIVEYISEQRVSPTVAEIAKGIEIHSRGVVYRYLKALEAAGLIELIANKKRNIRLTRSHGDNSLQVIGRIAAGLPIEALNHQADLDVNQLLKGQNRFALEVKGDSMIDEGIVSGDVVVCEALDYYPDGCIVVALIDNESATLKKYYQKNNRIELHSANLDCAVQSYAKDRVRVQGKMVGLIRVL